MKWNGLYTFLTLFILLAFAPLNAVGDFPPGDNDCSGFVDIDDVVYLIQYLYAGGPAPCDPVEFSGSITGNTGCKYFDKGADTDTTNTWDCIEWSYDGVSTLQIHHINAGLNCCPIFAAEFSITENTITIEELDSLEGGGCDCNCLFDIDYELVGVYPGVYTFHVIEPYIQPSDEELIFEMDLTEQTTGIECERRYFYPWNTEEY